MFDGLLPEPHNGMVMRLLFTCAHWHGLAKLRLHSDPTLDIMDEVTTTLGQDFREFKKTVCPAFATRELPKEASARQRRKIRSGTKAVQLAAKTAVIKQLRKEYNIQTYKHHAAGDYVKTIRHFGTTDSYSTTPVSLDLLSYFYNS